MATFFPIQAIVQTSTTTNAQQAMKIKPRNNAKQRRGAAMVEFAIVVPILFLFFFAAFEFCRANMIRHTVDNAVYEAARTGILPGATSGEVRDEAERILNTLGLNSSSIQVTPGQIEEDTEQVTVRVEVSLDDNSFIAGQFLVRQDIVR